MKIVFLESCGPDLNWFRDYYRTVFPEGRGNAARSYQKTKNILARNPEIGHPGDEPGLRELLVARTPFALVYRLKNNRIEVIRLWDQRAKRPEKWD